MSGYDTDFYGWANEQAALLRAGRLNDADIANIAEEIDSMGRSEKRELINRLAVLLAHLLKWHVQPGLRTVSWRLTIEEQRERLRVHLEDNPSLRPKLAEAYAQAYRLGRIAAERETGLSRAVLPAVSPWSTAQALDDAFYPE